MTIVHCADKVSYGQDICVDKNPYQLDGSSIFEYRSCYNSC